MPVVTLREIAEKIGCSRALVSYALRNGPYVSAATRQRITQAAESLGWTPNAELARQMSLTRATAVRPPASNLAVVIQKSKAALQNEEVPRLHLKGACDRAVRLGYQMNVFNLLEDPLPPRRLRTILRARGVRGIVFVATVGTLFSRELLEIGQDFACSVVGVRFVAPQYPTAITDFHANGLTCCQELRKAGYQRPVAVIPRGIDAPLGWGFGSGIYGGSKAYFPERDIPILYTGERDNNVPDSEKAGVLAFLRTHRPDAVLTTDTHAVSSFLKDATINPRPALFSFNWLGEKHAAGGIDQHYEAVGAAGVDLVIAQIHRNESGPAKIQRSVHIPGTWQWGTAKVKRSSRR